MAALNRADHARAWFRVSGEIYYLDCYSLRGFYKRGDGPYYAKEVKYSSFDDPLNYRAYEDYFE